MDAIFYCYFLRASAQIEFVWEDGSTFLVTSAIAYASLRDVHLVFREAIKEIKFAE